MLSCCANQFPRRLQTWAQGPNAVALFLEAVLIMRTAVLSLCGLLLAACGPSAEARHGWPGVPSPAAAEPGEKIEVPPPPFSDGIFPCTECHDPELGANTTKRTLTMAHEDIVLKHDAEHRWCLDCHSAENRDKLHLASGELVDFTESYKLCGQCHGDKYRDWRAGVHGRRSGEWNGHKSYLLCVNCHNSHDPAFKLHYVPSFKPDMPRSDKPLPPPVRPEDLAKPVAKGGDL